MPQLLSDLKAELENRPHIKQVENATVVPGQFDGDPDRDLYQFQFTSVAGNGQSSGTKKIRCSVFKLGVVGEEDAAWENGKGAITKAVAEFLFVDGITRLKTLTNCFNAWRVLELNHPQGFMIVKALTHAVAPTDKTVLHQGLWKIYTIHNVPSGAALGWNVSEVSDGGPISQDDYTDA